VHRRSSFLFALTALTFTACSSSSEGDSLVTDASANQPADAGTATNPNPPPPPAPVTDASAPVDAAAPATSCTETTGSAIRFTLDNRRAEGVLVTWLHYSDDHTSCLEASYGAIEASTVRIQESYAGHAWAVRSAKDGTLLKQFTVAGGETVVIP
jgi:hypothetical protein